MNSGRNRLVQLSLSQLTIADAHPLQLIDAASAGGFDAVGLRLVAPMPADAIVQIVGQDALIRDIAARLDATGLRLFDVDAVWLAPHTNVKSLVPALEVATRLGAQQVLVVGSDPDLGRFAEKFSTLCDNARALSLGVVLEFLPYSEIKSLREALDMLKRVQKKNARLLIDALHFYRSGGHPRDLATIDSSLIPYMHLCDATALAPEPDGLKAEGRTGRLYPGEGGLALGDLLHALPQDIPIGVEAPCAFYASLPILERARICGAATRSLLSGVFGPTWRQRA